MFLLSILFGEVIPFVAVRVKILLQLIYLQEKFKIYISNLLIIFKLFYKSSW